MVARAPAWSRDELILALDLYFRVGRPGRTTRTLSPSARFPARRAAAISPTARSEALIVSTLSYRTFLGSTPHTAAQE